jgi:hypothetical protein
VAFGQVRADYAVAKVIITQGCMGGKIDKDSCDALTAIDTRATIIRTQVEKALMDARSPVDWAQVMSYAATVSEMLIKLGVLAVK